MQAFHGHSTNVSLLQFSGYKNSYGKSTMDVDGRYFLSGSADDRVINVWYVVFVMLFLVFCKYAKTGSTIVTIVNLCQFVYRNTQL